MIFLMYRTALTARVPKSSTNTSASSAPARAEYCTVDPSTLIFLQVVQDTVQSTPIYLYSSR